jgi:hypothetical protein
MNLEDLISKYLDGDLSIEEDSVLRDRLSEDSVSKDKFEGSVNLHLAIKQDANSIMPPEDLLRTTEDMILMRIMASETAKRTKIVWSRYAVAASVIFILFLGNLFHITDLNFGNGNSIISDNGDATTQEIKSESNTTTTKQLIEPKSKKVTRLKSIDNGTNSTLLAVVSSNENAINNIETETTNSNTSSGQAENTIQKANYAEKNKDEMTLPEQIIPGRKENTQSFVPVIPTPNYEIMPSVPVIHSTQPIIASPIQMNNFASNAFDFQFDKPQDIRISSFFGTDVARSGINSKDNIVVSHYSESLDYSMNSKERLGLEVGYTEYSYDDKAVIRSKSYSNTSSKKTTIEGSGSGGANTYYSYTLPLSLSKQIYWGSAFYERELFDMNSLRLNGRMGAGWSDEGPLGYARLYAQYKFYGGIYFTLGAEGRLFVAQFPKFQQTGDDLKSTASIIYGLQYKF